MRIHDPVSGTSVGLIYRLPSTAERVAYFASLLERQGDVAVSSLLETRRRSGLAVLCGLSEGDFELPTEGGGCRRLSSDAASADYEPRWKELIEERAPELVEALAYHVFEGQYATVRAPVVGDASKKK